MRENILDRPSSVIGAVTQGEYAPHSQNNRVSYAVPTGKRSYLNNAMLEIRVTGAPTVVGNKWMYVTVEKNGAAWYTVAQVMVNSGTVGYSETVNVHIGMWLEPLDVVRIFTEDMATGGLAEFEGHFIGREYSIS